MEGQQRAMQSWLPLICYISVKSFEMLKVFRAKTYSFDEWVSSNS